MADQQDKRRRLGARVWLVVDGKKKRPGVLWWIGEDTVMLREDGAPGLRGSRGATRENAGASWATPTTFRRAFRELGVLALLREVPLRTLAVLAAHHNGVLAFQQDNETRGCSLMDGRQGCDPPVGVAAAVIDPHALP